MKLISRIATDQLLHFFDKNIAYPMLLLPIQHCDIQKVPYREAGIQKPQHSPYLQCYRHTLSSSDILAGKIHIDQKQFPAQGIIN